jgi:hypothetical protein
LAKTTGSRLSAWDRVPAKFQRGAVDLLADPVRGRASANRGRADKEHRSCTEAAGDHMVQKTKLHNILQMLIVSAPPVLMALAGLLLRSRPRESALAQKPKQADRKRSSGQG